MGEAIAAVIEEAMLDVWIDLESMFPRRMTALTESEADALRHGLAALAETAAGLVLARG